MICANDATCFNQIRMYRSTFDRLCEMLTTLGGLTPTKNMLVDEQVAIFLHILAHHVKNRVIQFEFKRSGESISRSFNRVVECMMRLQGHLLKKPEPIPEDSTDGRWKWFKNCLGALDGTHIKMQVGVKDKPRYRNRKGEISSNVLGVCSQDGQFIYVLAGWEGSAADARVLKDAILRPNGLKVPTDCYYLVDAGYTNGRGFLAPYRGQRYHLNEWRNGRQPVTPHECFNMRHSSARNVIERCFGMLKMRWAILRSPSFYPVRTHTKIVIACCLLHNLVNRYNGSDPVVEAIPDGVGGGDDDVSSIPMDVEPISTVEPSTEWTNWRDSLANEMFNDFRSRMSQQTQGSASSKRPMRLWSHEEDKALVDSMLELRLGGTFNADNGLKGGSLRDLEAKMEAKLPGCGIKAIPHIQSRYKNLKGTWKEVYDMLYGTNSSGFGWDPHTCMVLAERDVWDNYLRIHKKCGPYRSKPFPLFESLTELFGKDRATGKESRSTNDVPGEMPNEGENEVMDNDDVYIPQLNEEADMSVDDISTQEPESSSAKRQKRGKAKEGAEEGFNCAVDKICASMNHGLEQATKELCVHLMKNEIELGEKLDKLYDDLLLVNGISYNEVFHAHIHLSSNPHQMLSYFSLPDNAKLFWVRALLEKK
ncbi:protein ALP1-like [Senna tora]|uniref:Protein ALP1-like n=1 Tax=Senna tora TaxID=362788 RepID=A0A834SHC8_9FABA|nr:protein ALP1-like [Senna tora]